MLALAALASGCDGRPKSGSVHEREPKHGPEVAVIDLAEGAPEIEGAGFLGVAVHKASFDRLVRATEALAKDDDVKAVLVRFGDASMGMARAQELADRLEPIRASGKPVVCHGDGFTNGTMMAAARGCSKIWVSPAGGVESVGLALQLVYFHKLLAEELHLNVDFLQVGKYKGAEEPFTRDGPSDEARATMESMLGDIRATWLAGVKKGRAREGVAEAVEDGPYSPGAARDRGLIDEIGYADDALAALKKESGAVRDEVRFGHGAAESDDDLPGLVRLLAGSHASSAPIAIVRASGSIAMRGGGGLLGGQSGITEQEMVKVLARVENDDAIKALVLRVDSPGGSALASDLIWHQLRKVREKKPVVVSVGDMAASGGYYISSAANAIYAEPGSIVGSIGVVGGKVSFGDAVARFGVHAETLAANKESPTAAARAGYTSPLSAWDDATRKKLLESMTGIYELFLARIAEGRSTTKEKVAPFAEGRLFSGVQAKANGLVDELGGLHDAIEKARALAKLSADAEVTTITGHAGLLEQLAADGDGDDSRSPVGDALEAAAAARAGAGTPIAAIGRVAPEMVPFVSSLEGIVQRPGPGAVASEGGLVALPFALILR